MGNQTSLCSRKISFAKKEQTRFGPKASLPTLLLASKYKSCLQPVLDLPLFSRHASSHGAGHRYRFALLHLCGVRSSICDVPLALGPLGSPSPPLFVCLPTPCMKAPPTFPTQPCKVTLTFCGLCTGFYSSTLSALAHRCHGHVCHQVWKVGMPSIKCLGNCNLFN